MTARRPRRPDSQPPGLELHFVDDDEQIRGLDLVELEQRDNRSAAQVHERQRLRENGATHPPGGHHGLDAARRRRPLGAVPLRQQIHRVEPDVVPRAGVARTGVA